MGLSYTCCTGTAGVGKTHLVLEVLNAWRQHDDNESIFCDLSTAMDTMSIAQNLARALTLNLSSNDPLKQIEQVLLDLEVLVRFA